MGQSLEETRHKLPKFLSQLGSPRQAHLSLEVEGFYQELVT